MASNEDSAKANVSAGVGFQANEGARFVSSNVRNIAAQFKAKMSRFAEVTDSAKGSAFEFLDAMDQAVNLGGQQEVKVHSVNTKNSPDVSVGERLQQHKFNSRKADQAARGGNYGKQEVRTPKDQPRAPKNPNVKESNVSASDVNKGANNPSQTANHYQFKAAIAEITNAAAIGAITGAVAAAVFLDTIEGAVIGGLSSAVFAAIPAFIPALIPVLTIVSVPLMVVGAFQLVNQIGQILDHHAFAKRNALLKQVHQQDAKFFESFDNQVMEYLYS
jgi:hypothetical protein